jgi:putative membrane protein
MREATASPWKRSQERLRAIGTEPDYRFSLANERTFLAYLRTSIAFFAAGAAAIELVHLFDDEVYDRLLGASLILVGLLMSASSYSRWRRREEAIRQSAALPYSSVPLFAAVAMTVIGAATVTAVLVLIP